VNKDLVDIKHDADGVTAFCADGSSFRGDILLGADGVFSKTRRKMWELAEPQQPEIVKADRNCKQLWRQRDAIAYARQASFQSTTASLAFPAASLVPNSPLGTLTHRTTWAAAA
jgi:2-polyprenyl-6-methoxyphenol hydroxylase-like FAD-dependent oxidoreductase